MTPGDPSAKSADGRRMGVHVAAIQIDPRAVRWQHDPSNPLAEKAGEHTGYVLVPDISLVTEQINKLEAERAYEANLAAAEATKSMMAQALRLIA
jgi:flagellar basal-body rod protein FlgC